MAKTRGTGLLMVWTDIDPEHEAEFNRFYNEEHMPRLAQVPGFLSAGRYVALRGGPKYLAMYELDDHNVLRTTAFLDELRYRPSPLRTKAAGSYIGRNYIINGYRQIFPERTNPIDNTMGPSPYLQMGRITIAQAFEDEFNAWYNTCYIPGYLTVPGCLRARRYVAVDGVPKYLTVYEFANPGVPDSEAWNTVRNANPWNLRMRPHVQLDPGSPAVFRRIYPEPAG
jgi:hypothetical protein